MRLWEREGLEDLKERRIKISYKVYAYPDTFKKFKNNIIYFFIFKEDNKIFK